MRLISLSLAIIAAGATYVMATEEEVQIDIVTPVECSRKSQKGDSIEVHYRGTLASDGTEFDASYNRGTPLAFTVGNGQVIKG
jgi:FK506-binding protein 2